jgi:hypothetical protein
MVPEYASVDHRRQSFLGRQIPAGQSVPALVDAGFFYIGPEDNVKCYYCGGSLKSWQPTDKPWGEHIRWFPHCPLMQVQQQSQNLQQFQQLSLSDNNRNAALSNTGYNIQGSVQPSDLPFAGASQPHRGHSAVPSTMLPVFVEQSVPCLSEDSSVKPQQHSAMETSELSVSGSAAGASAATTAGDEVPTNDPAASMEKLQAENRRLKDSILCKICMDAEVNTLFLPCGHLVCCDKCAPKISECPICRVGIRGSIRTYIT